MTILKRIIFAVVPFSCLALSAQLVQKATPTPTSSRASTPGASKGKKPVAAKGLDAYGITNRVLASWKRSGAREELGFKVVTIQRKEGADHFTPTFELFGRDAFALTANPSLIGMVRLPPTGPELSIDLGKTWSKGEQNKDSWLFAFDNQMVTLDPMDDAFTPTEFKAVGFERGVVVKDDHGVENRFDSPLFHSAIVGYAFGRNEVQGIIKFPGTTFVVPFQGIRSKGKWIGRSIGTAPFVGDLTKRRTDGGHLSHGLKTQCSVEIVQVDLNDQRLLLGTGGYLNYAQPGDPSERLKTAIEFDLSKAKELPDLAQAYHVNFSRSIWTKSDEEASFSHEAEKAFIQAGLKAWFWEPYVQVGNGYGSGAWAKEGHALIEPMLQRVKATGGTFGLVDDQGQSVNGQRGAITAPISGTGQGLSAASARMPKLTLGAAGDGSHLISLHFPSELRVWADGMKIPSNRIPAYPGEQYTSIALAPDGHCFVTSSSMGVRLWNADSGQPVGVLPVDNCRGYYCATYAPSGTLIAGGGSDGRTRLWDAGSGKWIATIKGGGGFSISFGDTPNAKPIFVASLAFSADGKRIVEGLASGELRVWDLADPSQPKKLKAIDLPGFGKVWRVRFLHGGQELLAVNQAGSYQVFDTTNWKLARKNDGVMPMATSILFSPTDDQMVTSYEGGRVTRTNLDSGMTDRDVTVEGILCGALLQREGKTFLLGDDEWKVVPL